MSFLRSGRIMVYPAEVLTNTDLLRQEFFRMVDASNVAQATLGGGLTPSDIAIGLNCTPVASTLTVNIGQGVLWSFVEADATAYPADNSGLNLDTIDKLFKPFTAIGAPLPGQLDTGAGWVAGTGGTSWAISPVLPAAATVGNSIAYLIEAQPTTSDLEAPARQYYNPSSPPNPITNAFNDNRIDYPFLKVKPGVQGNPPVIPTPDAGYDGLWVVTVPQGATSITTGMIAPYSAAPFLAYSLPQLIVGLQNGQPFTGTDTGNANAYVVANNPVYGAAQIGTRVSFKAAHSNTAASTLNASTDGATALQVETPLGLGACVGGEIISGTVYDSVWTGSVWQLKNPSTKPSYSYSVSQASAAQTIPKGNVATKVTYDTTDFTDAYGIISFSSNQFTVNVSGRYLIKASLGFNISGVTEPHSVYGEIYVNGTNVQRLSQVSNQTDNCTVTGSVEVFISSGQVVLLNAFNASDVSTGHDYNLITGAQDNRLQIQYLGQ